MEIRRRRRRGKRCLSILIHCEIIVIAILTIVTFWNVQHVAHRMAIPVITTESTVISSILIESTTFSNVCGYIPPICRRKSWIHRRRSSFFWSTSSTSSTSTTLLVHPPQDDTTATSRSTSTTSAIGTGGQNPTTYKLMTWNLLAPGTFCVRYSINDS